MAAHYEKAFIQHLCLPESLVLIVERDLPSDLLPTPELGAIHRFAIDYWHAEASPLVAPTPDVLRVHFANVLAEHEINLDIEPEGILEWALQSLRGAYMDRHWQPIVREIAISVGGPEVDILDKAMALDAGIEKLMNLQNRFTRRTERVDITQGVQMAIESYLGRAGNVSDGQLRGITLGMDLIDRHSGGIRPGEMCLLAGGPKSGKSYWLLWAAFCEWLRGGNPTLFSLENSVELSIDRLICMVLGIDATPWDMGRLPLDLLERVQDWRTRLSDNNHPFTILQPEPGKRTMSHLLRLGRATGDSIFLDQLTFVEPPSGTDRKSKTEQIGMMLHDGKATISSGHRVPLVIAHQINREGVKAAEKTGHLKMYHLADSAEVERTADRVYGLWVNAPLRDIGRAWVQTLAVRRSNLTHWEIEWRPWIGRIRPLNEITLPEER